VSKIIDGIVITAIHVFGIIGTMWITTQTPTFTGAILSIGGGIFWGMSWSFIMLEEVFTNHRKGKQGG